MNNKIVKKAVLILSGATLGTPTVCIPQPKKAPNAIVVSQYIKDGKYCAIASEQRKREILSNIKDIRKQIKIKAERYQIDEDTVITAVTATQKSHLHARKLIDSIVQKIV